MRHNIVLELVVVDVDHPDADPYADSYAYPYDMPKRRFP